MSVLTKAKTWAGTLILITAVGLAYGIFDRNDSSPFRSRFGKDVDLVLHVIYEPRKGTPVIAVQHSATIPLAYTPTQSPWEVAYRAPVATRVILSVLQERGGTTECTILDNGVVRAHNYMHGPGNISCIYLVE